MPQSLALDKITSVRDLNNTLAHLAYPTNYLVVTDVHGARLGVATTDSDGLQVISEAVQRAQDSGIRISPRAVLLLASTATVSPLGRRRSLLLIPKAVWLLLTAAYVAIMAALVA